MSFGSSRGRASTRSGLSGNRLSAIFLGLVLLGGGAGSSYPLVQLALELLGIAIILRVIFARSLPLGDPAFRAGLAIFAGAAALLFLQLIPLPAALWHALPGRESAVAVHSAMGWPSRWHAFSLTPDATFRMLLTLLPPLAAFLLAATVNQSTRILALRVIVAVALVSTIVGALQVAAGQSAPVLYATAHRGFGVGFFVNRNHQAVFLLIAIVLAAVPGVIPTGRAKGRRVAVERRLGAVGVVALLALGVLATTSRTAMAALPVAVLVSLALIFEVKQARRWMIGAAIAYVVAGAALYPTSLVQQPLARFATVGEDLRYQYWQNSWFALREAFPWGTGFGSFDHVYRSVEPLDQVSPLRVNNAHNDFLEVALEGGLPAILLMLAALAAVLWILVGAWRRAGNRTDRTIAAAGLAGITFVLLFSIVDYPLRMTAISAISAFLLGCGINGQSSRAYRAGQTTRPALQRYGIPAFAAVVALAALCSGLASAAVWRAMPGVAVVLAPWSSSAWLALANQAQMDEKLPDSERAAARALGIAPMEAGAVRAAAYAAIARGDTARGSALFQNAAALGWRDRMTQVWLVQAGLAAGNLQIAAERLDALLRQGTLAEPLMQQMRIVFQQPGGEAAIVERLASGPPWRQGFLNGIADEAPENPAKLLAMLRQMRAAGVPATPQETSLIRWRLGDAGNFGAARAIWLASGGRGVIEDPGFEAQTGIIPAGGAPYAWRAPTLAGVRAMVAEGGAGGSRQSALLTSDGYAGGVALAQTIALRPGAYRIAATLRRSDGRTSAPGALRVTCAGTDTALAVLQPRTLTPQWTRLSASFIVPPGCGAQVVAFTLQQTMGEGASIGIDEIAIETPLG